MAFDPSSLRVGFLAGTLGRGGAERQLIYMLRALQNEGVRVRVLCLTKGEALEQEILDLGVDVDWVGASQNNFVRLGKIIGNLRAVPVDVIQSAHFYTNMYASLAGRTLSIPSVGAIRSDVVNEISANGVFGRWHLTLPKHLIANSQLAVDRAIAKGIDGPRIHLVRNAVADGNGLRPFDIKREVNLLFAGRLDSAKRPELFIELAAALRVLHPGVELKFLIAGDGPLRSSLEQKAKEKGLAGDEVIFLGEQANMSEIYQRSDILVLTSRREGTPNVVLEAMANGLAVVATRVGGVPEILGKECGVLVEPDDLQAIVNAVQTLILDRSVRFKMGDRAREYVRKNHSVEYLQDRLTGIYSQVLAKK